jgi:outer membrane protein assembly factor BamB
MFGGALVATERDANAIVRRDPSNGRVLDRYADCLSNNTPAGYAVAGNRVYWLQLTELVAADLGAGRRLWTLPLGRSGSPQSTLPVVVDGRLYVGASDGGYLYSIDARQGTAEWRFRVRENGRYGPAPIRVGDVLLVQYEQLTAYRIPPAGVVP